MGVFICLWILGAFVLVITNQPRAIRSWSSATDTPPCDGYAHEARLKRAKSSTN
jgi:hypothetical protein